MTNRILKDFRNAIHRDLKIVPQNKKSSCFVIEEKQETSVIKEIQLTFKNQDDVLILKQDNTDDLKKNYTIANLFQNNLPNTNKSCDFIVFHNSKDVGLEIFYCEIKSSKESLNEAIMQIESSKLFILYLLEYYKYRYSKNDLEYSQIPYKKFYIYPKKGMPDKIKVYRNDKGKVLYLRAVEIDSNNGCAKIPNGYDFFNFKSKNS